MKTERGIKIKIKQIEMSLRGQRLHAKRRKGDGHDKTRDKAIIVREGYLSALKWVLN